MSARFTNLTTSVLAGAQFLGTEFAQSGTPGRPLALRKLQELLVRMGSESKSWRLEKVWTIGAITVRSILRQSLTSGGIPGANTDTDVVINGDDARSILLFPGQHLELITVGATAAMQASLILEEFTNDPVESLRDPKATR